jgi:hypothetical protein
LQPDSPIARTNRVEHLTLRCMLSLLLKSFFKIWECAYVVKIYLYRDLTFALQFNAETEIEFEPTLTDVSDYHRVSFTTCFCIIYGSVIIWIITHPVICFSSPSRFDRWFPSTFQIALKSLFVTRVPILRIIRLEPIVLRRILPFFFNESFFKIWECAYVVKF